MSESNPAVAKILAKTKELKAHKEQTLRMIQEEHRLFNELLTDVDNFVIGQVVDHTLDKGANGK